MYVVGEALFPTFQITMNTVVEKAGLPNECLKIGPLKDPVRIYEKVVTTRSISSLSYHDHHDQITLPPRPLRQWTTTLTDSTMTCPPQLVLRTCCDA